MGFMDRYWGAASLLYGQGCKAVRWVEFGFCFVFAFYQQLLQTSNSYLVQIPILGPELEDPVRNLLSKEKLHSGTSDQGGSILGSWLWICTAFILQEIDKLVIKQMGTKMSGLTLGSTRPSGPRVLRVSPSG